MNTMRAVVLTGHGGYECLQVRGDVPIPQPAVGEVLIRITAAAVNNTDVNTRIGWYSGGGWTGSFEFPRIQGIDGCGYIAEVGPGVATSRVGERVLVEPCWRRSGEPISAARFFGSEVDGSFAEFAVVPAIHAHSINSVLTDVELATFPCSYSTAENMLSRVGLGRGERVLITGASGGVGSAAIQLAAGRGAHVVAVAAEAKHGAVRALGAELAVARGTDLTETFSRDPFDVVVDVAGGASWSALLDVLRAGGRYATAGAIAGAEVSLDLRTLYLKDLALFGCTVLDAGVFASLVRHIEAGELKPVVAEVLPLDEIVTAQQIFLAKTHVGKIVLSVARDYSSAR